MERRNALKIMLAAAIAPAFVAKGLMKVKPLQPAPEMPHIPNMAQLGHYAGMTWHDSHCQNHLDFEHIKAAVDKYKNRTNYDKILVVVHPSQAADIRRSIEEKSAIDPKYLASVKWMNENLIESQYVKMESGLLMSKRQALLNGRFVEGNRVGRNGFFKPIWEEEDEKI